MTSPPPEPLFDATHLSTARRYSDLLGDKDSLAVDRHAADELQKALPSVRRSATELRHCLHRMVHHLAREHRVRQFLDIGCGYPHPPNVHDIAQHIGPTCRIVYTDHDPIVGAHARALLTSKPEGATTFVPGDLHDIDTLMADTTVRNVLDFTKPIAVLLCAVLHFITDHDEALHIVTRIREALPAGSFLAITHVTFDPLTPDRRRRLADLARSGQQGAFTARTRQQITAYFTGLTMVAPGVVPTVHWHPELHPRPRATATDAVAYAGIGRITPPARPGKIA
jgi:hypothetical protein